MHLCIDVNDPSWCRNRNRALPSSLRSSPPPTVMVTGGAATLTTLTSLSVLLVTLAALLFHWAHSRDYILVDIWHSSQVSTYAAHGYIHITQTQVIFMKIISVCFSTAKMAQASHAQCGLLLLFKLIQPPSLTLVALLLDFALWFYLGLAARIQPVVCEYSMIIQPILTTFLF